MQNKNDFIKDEEVMLKLIGDDITNISLDQTYSGSVYLKFLELYKSQVLSESNLIRIGYTEAEAKKLQVQIDEIANEIVNPSSVENGQYKIPHEVLFDAIKLTANEIFSDDGFGMFGFDSIYNCFLKYKEFDGMLEASHGQKLHSLYSDTDKYLYMHKINYRGQNLSESELQEIAENICKTGLKLTTFGNEVGKLEYTTLGNQVDKWFSMLDYMSYWSANSGVVVLQIPKDIIDDGKPCIGSDKGKELSSSNPGTMLPEYVIGFVKSGSFVQNPYDSQDRKQYKFVVPESRGISEKTYY